MKKWYELLYENYGNKYDTEMFVQGTAGECDFFEKEIHYDKSLKILDIGCGTGRHSIELAKRGYTVKGIDLSESLLARAREKARIQGVQVDFERHDARQLPFRGAFDLAIMICEAAFSLMETDEMNYQVLGSAANAIRPGGKLIFTTLNGLFPFFHSLQDFHAEGEVEGHSSCTNNTFDLMTFRDFNTVTVEDDSGNRKELQCNERYYVPPEITWMLKSLGFDRISIHGAKLGAFSRDDRLSPDDFEMLVIAEKHGN